MANGKEEKRPVKEIPCFGLRWCGFAREKCSIAEADRVWMRELWDWCTHNCNRENECQSRKSTANWCTNSLSGVVSWNAALQITRRLSAAIEWNDDSSRIEIWLILPELMCSFQRLSHACISINDLIVKPRTAHYNSYNLLDLDNPTWITVVILELIHAPKLWPCGKSAFIRTKPSGFGRFLLTQNN
jgi:hypothetical protein